MPNLKIFSKEIRTNDGLYSLNDLHKASGNNKRHLPAQFLRNQQTKELLEEILKYANSHNLVIKKSIGKNGGTWVCKELVYAYAMWISPKFHLQVIRAFDQMATQPPEKQSTQTGQHADAEKYRLLNNMIRSMGFINEPVVVPVINVVHLVQTVRYHQQQIAAMQTPPMWMEDNISQLKQMTGLTLLDDRGNA